MEILIYLIGLVFVVAGLCGLLDHIERQPTRMDSQLYTDWIRRVGAVLLVLTASACESRPVPISIYDWCQIQRRTMPEEEYLAIPQCARGRWMFHDKEPKVWI